MIYALRKLIAFVFLGGIFWYIYRDPANVENPVFMNTLGILAAVFGVFWLVVPSLVVWIRIRQRRQRNAMRFEEWLKKTQGQLPRPFPAKDVRLALSDGESAYFHEKGTVYVEPGVGLDELSVRGAPGDVAFPGLGRRFRKIQRTHFYLTDRRIVFAGKALDYSIAYAELADVKAMPGGLVFIALRENKKVKFAFTFQNPLVVAETLRRVRG